jgi:multiple sugar transport system substrate-binding protein
VGFRLRPGEAITVVCVLALSVAASWPALGPAIGFSGSADAVSQTSNSPATSAPPATGDVPVAPSTTASPTPPVTLSLLAPDYGVNNDDTYWNETISAFEAANPSITLGVNRVAPAALATQARSDLAAGSVDLILGLHPDDVRTATASGQLYPQSQVVSPNAGVLPGLNYLEEGSGPGGGDDVYGIPFTGTTLELYCNMSLFVAPGIDKPPTTWAELAADAAKIKAEGKIGYGLAMAPGDAAATAQMWMSGGAGEGFSSGPGGRIWSVDMPNNVKALRWLDDNLVKPGLTEPRPQTQSMQDVEKQFLAGDVGMMIADSHLVPLTQAQIGGALWVVPMPGMAGPVQGPLGSVDDFLAANAHPEHKEAVTKLLAYLLSPQSETYFARIHGTEPLAQPAIDAEHSDPRTLGLTSQLKEMTWLPTRAVAWPAVQKAIADNLPKALTSDPQAVLDRIQAAATAASPTR